MVISDILDENVLAFACHRAKGHTVSPASSPRPHIEASGDVRPVHSEKYRSPPPPPPPVGFIIGIAGCNKR